LTDVVPVLERKRRLTQWDIKPPGYENVTAEQAKLSGMFPLPGAPRQQPMDPSRLQAFINQPANAAAASALKPSQARQSKRLFVYNIPASVTDSDIVEFFNLHLNGLNVVSGADPCLSSQISTDRSYSMLEFRNPGDATMALALDGISMDGNDNMETTDGTMNGDRAGFSIRRPRDYIAPTNSTEPGAQEGILSNIVKDSPEKLCISQIPTHLTEDMVKELLEAFGELKSLVLVTDPGADQSRVSTPITPNFFI
jgi:splicing factor U2AF subunit